MGKFICLFMYSPCHCEMHKGTGQQSPGAPTQRDRNREREKQKEKSKQAYNT